MLKPSFRGLAPLRRRDFALFWIGFAVTRFGRAAEEAGVVWLFYSLTQSAVLLGVLGLARAVPSIVLSPIAGAVADRSDARRILLITQSAGMVTSLALFAGVAMGWVEFWHIYVQVAIQASIEAFDGGTRLTLYPRLVPRPELSEAVALNSTAGRTAQFVGPAVAGVMIGTIGDAAPFLLNAATFLALICAVLLMRPTPLALPVRPTTLREQLMEGLHFIAVSRVMTGLLRLEVVVSIFQVNAVMITIVAQEVLGGGPVQLGLLLSAPALGALSAVVALVAFGPSERQGRLVVISGVVYGIAVVGFGLGLAFPLAFALLTVAGAADATMTVSRQSIMQLGAPPEMRGRVMGTMAVVTRGASPLAETQSGTLAGLLGPTPASAVAGAALVTASLLTFANRPLWNFKRDAIAER